MLLSPLTKHSMVAVGSYSNILLTKKKNERDYYPLAFHDKQTNEFLCLPRYQWSGEEHQAYRCYKSEYGPINKVVVAPSKFKELMSEDA